MNLSYCNTINSENSQQSQLICATLQQMIFSKLINFNEIRVSLTFLNQLQEAQFFQELQKMLNPQEIQNLSQNQSFLQSQFQSFVPLSAKISKQLESQPVKSSNYQCETIIPIQDDSNKIKQEIYYQQQQQQQKLPQQQKQPQQQQYQAQEKQNKSDSKESKWETMFGDKQYSGKKVSQSQDILLTPQQQLQIKPFSQQIADIEDDNYKIGIKYSNNLPGNRQEKTSQQQEDSANAQQQQQQNSDELKDQSEENCCLENGYDLLSKIVGDSFKRKAENFEDYSNFFRSVPSNELKNNYSMILNSYTFILPSSLLFLLNRDKIFLDSLLKQNIKLEKTNFKNKEITFQISSEEVAQQLFKILKSFENFPQYEYRFDTEKNMKIILSNAKAHEYLRNFSVYIFRDYSNKIKTCLNLLSFQKSIQEIKYIFNEFLRMFKSERMFLFTLSNTGIEEIKYPNFARWNLNDIAQVKVKHQKLQLQRNQLKYPQLNISYEQSSYYISHRFVFGTHSSVMFKKQDEIYLPQMKKEILAESNKFISLRLSIEEDKFTQYEFLENQNVFLYLNQKNMMITLLCLKENLIQVLSQIKGIKHIEILENCELLSSLNQSLSKMIKQSEYLLQGYILLDQGVFFIYDLLILQKLINQLK